MGKIDIFRNILQELRNTPVTSHNALLRTVQATASTHSGTVHSPTWR